MRYLQVLLVMCAIVFFAACVDEKVKDKNVTFEVTKNESNITKEVMQVDLEKLKLLARDNNDFGFKLFAEMKNSEQKNILISPFSLSEALAMTYLGSDEDTKSEISKVMNFKGNDKLFHGSFNALDTVLNKSRPDNTLKTVNALWFDKSYEVNESFTKELQKNYGNKLKSMDFKHQLQSSIAEINTWIEKNSNGTLKNTLNKNGIDKNVQLILTNVVYFKAGWMNEFYKESTTQEKFYALNGTVQDVSMLNNEYEMLYAENKDFQSVTLDYSGGDSSMVILLSKQGRFEKVMKNLKSNYQLANELSKLELVNLKLLKMKFSTPTYDMKTYFEAMGLVLPFSENANFSLIGSQPLKISDIKHKAFIEIDEKGTEASAVTDVEMCVIVEEKITEPIPKKMHINRDFIFFIKDNQTSQILFMGLIKEIV